MTRLNWTWSALITACFALGAACNDPSPVPPGLEQGDALCTDQKDNDADGQTDCADPDCKAVPACIKKFIDQGGTPTDAGPDVVRFDLGNKLDRGQDLGDRDQNPGADGPVADLPSVVMPPPDPPLVEDSNYYFPTSLQKKVDLLVVVDNTNSMELEQANLASNFPKLIDSLALMSGGLPDIHIGVISTDLGAGNYGLQTCEIAGGDQGVLQNAARIPGCTPPSNKWISYENGVSNITGSGDELTKVKEAFACISRLGTGGCGFEHTLDSARQALDPALGRNSGFLRADALLVVLFVTDEDDCSAQVPQLFYQSSSGLTDPLGPLSSFRCFEFGFNCTPNGRQAGPRENCLPAGDWLYKLEAYQTFFRGLKPLGQIVLAAIAGPAAPVAVTVNSNVADLAPSCQAPTGTAVPALRIKALVDAFGPTGMFNPADTSICSADFSPALTLLGTRIAAQLGQSCLGPLTDTDPMSAGIQADCQVADKVGPVINNVPACITPNGACNPCPCWRASAKAECTGMGQGYTLEVARSQPAAAGTIVQASCLGPVN